MNDNGLRNERDEMMTLKRVPTLLLAGVLAFLLITAVDGNLVRARAADGEVLIGMNAPVTGGAASEAVYFLKAVKLAEKHINESGGINGKKLRVVVQDNQSTNPGALAALNKSVEQDKVLAILGPIKSTQILAISDAVKNYGIPTMIGGTNVNLTKQGNPWLFRCRPDDSITAQAIVKYIKEDLGLKKIGILHDSDAFGTGGADMVEKYAKENGLTIVKREKHTTRDKDYTAQLLSLKAAGTEAFVHYGTILEDIAVVLRQYRQLGSPFKYVGPPANSAKDTLALAQGAAEGILTTADSIPDQTEEYKWYAAEYRKAYNEEMDAWAAWNYDAIMVLANAIKTAGEDRGKIREAILALQNYPGALGTYSFTPNGDGRHQVCIVKVEGGAQKLLKIINIAP